MHITLSLIVFALHVLPRVSGHAAFFHPSMFGFNVTAQTYPYDNRPVAPIKNMPFSQWWFHNHLDHPPNAGDVFTLPAGETATAEIACTKGATSFFASAEGGDIRNKSNPNDVCPGSPMIEYHTQGFNDLEGCSLAIAYKSDVEDVKPEDFTVFSVNQTCVWTRFTDFKVPGRMPPCPEGGCICAFFWIHAPDAGGEENYMNGFKCNVTGSTSSVPLATSKVARRCGADPANKRMQSVPGNCTYGAKTPFYWFNNERNNMFEGSFSPPVYNDLYNFLDGAQNDIFQDSYTFLPDPSPTAPLPVLASNSTLGGGSANSTTTTSGGGGKKKTCTIRKQPSAVPSLAARGLPGALVGRRGRRSHSFERRRVWDMW